MHNKPMSESEGQFQADWKPTKAESPHFKCRKCGSDDVWYRIWDSDCGGFEDAQYECHCCGYKWWCESSDS
jgi:DNA-directed RNA polymerase subunit M/transcription elongation factor TFIIS